MRGPDEETPYWRAVHVDGAGVAWHLVYLSGLVLVVLRTAVALAGRREQRAPPWLARTGAALLALGGAAQLLAAGS